MTSGLILSTNFTDTTKHRWCFLGASSADTKQTNKNASGSEKNPHTAKQEFSSSLWEQQSIQFVDLDSHRMSEMICLKDQERSCNCTSIFVIPADTLTANGTIPENIVWKTAAPSGSFSIYCLWYPPGDTVRPFTAYFSGISWHHNNTGNDSHKADPESSCSSHTYNGNSSSTSEKWLLLLLSTEARLPSRKQACNKRCCVYS